MRLTSVSLACALTLLGTLPMLAATLLHDIPMAASYGAVILAFLAGLHWQIGLSGATRTPPRHLLLSSNIAALLAWLALLLPAPWAPLLLALGLVWLLTIDLVLRDAGLIPAWFYRLRQCATMVLVICLCVLMR